MFRLQHVNGVFTLSENRFAEATQLAQSFVEHLRELTAFVMVGTVPGSISQRNSNHAFASFPWYGRDVTIHAADVDTAALLAVLLWVEWTGVIEIQLVSVIGDHDHEVNPARPLGFHEASTLCFDTDFATLLINCDALSKDYKPCTSWFSSYHHLFFAGWLY